MRLGNEIFLFKNHAENELGRLVPDLFFKSSVSGRSTLVLIYFGRP